ncbi:MAG: hypothetical protein LBS86_05290 [Treponema sp.]|jgi:hypothetical protein|nr:hypothetical protein [Treponema sp.]
MREIIFPELVVVMLLLIPIIRPFVRGLRPQEGLVWLPPISLALCLALFPAYGFRPECIPLLIFAVIMNLRNKADLVMYISRSYLELFPEQNLPVLLVSLLFLFVVTSVALWFSPALETKLLSDNIRSVRVRGERNAELFVRIYEHAIQEPTPRPVMLVVPPELGSVRSVDRLCGELRQAGFTVITYSRPGVDMPAIVEHDKPRWPGIAATVNLLQAHLSGSSVESANLHGRRLEQERQRDVEALLAALPELAPDAVVMLAGYNAGGSALVQLAANTAFINAYPQVKGAIAVENWLWSVYTTPQETIVNVKRGWFSSIMRKLAGLWPKKVFPTGQLPLTTLPTLFMVSDRVTNQAHREAVYGPVVRALRSSNALLVAVEGAGTLDYTDCPAKYPLYSLFFSGRNVAVWRNEEFITGTVAVMANFAAQVLAEPGTPHRKTALTKTSYLETGGNWNLSNPQYILFP